MTPHLLSLRDILKVSPICVIHSSHCCCNMRATLPELLLVLLITCHSTPPQSCRLCGHLHTQTLQCTLQVRQVRQVKFIGQNSRCHCLCEVCWPLDLYANTLSTSAALKASFSAAHCLYCRDGSLVAGAMKRFSADYRAFGCIGARYPVTAHRASSSLAET